MGYLKRKKQPHAFRANLPEKHRTGEQRREGVASWQLPLKHCTEEQRRARAVGQAPAPAAPDTPRKAPARRRARA